MDKRSSNSTAAANAARTRKKHERWAKEMRASGWFVKEMLPKAPHGRLDWPTLYATNGLGETYRVTGRTGADEPILRGMTSDFVGLQGAYIYTHGPEQTETAGE